MSEKEKQTYFRGSYLCRNCGTQRAYHGLHGECLPKEEIEKIYEQRLQAGQIDPALANTDGTKDEWKSRAEQAEAQVLTLTNALKAVFAILEEAPELNMSNYDHDQVAVLNAQMVEAYSYVSSVLLPAPAAETKGAKEPFYVKCYACGHAVAAPGHKCVESGTAESAEKGMER